MTEQTSRLAIILDSTGAEKNADSLASALNKKRQRVKKLSLQRIISPQLLKI
ncbi:TPA: hypothetical protein ACOJ2T_005136 [Klebsiella pneumoniae]